MATAVVGRECKVTFGTDLISNLTDFSFTIEAPLLGEDVFGNDGWATVAGAGTKKCAGALNGLIDVTDTLGQVLLENACISGTKVTNLRLYTDEANYWTSNTGEDADAGCYFANYAPNVAASDIVKFSCDFQFHGRVHRTTSSG